MKRIFTQKTVNIKPTRSLQAFASSRKHTFVLHILKEEITDEAGEDDPLPSISTNSYWDGGSKSSFFGYRIPSFGMFSIDQNSCGGFPAFKSCSHTLQPGEMIMVLGTFYGKPATPRFYMHEKDYPAFALEFGLEKEISL